MKLVKLLMLVLALLIFLAKFESVSAIYNPLDVPNNKYGIHILNEHDIDSAANLVNSSGGDWGYVTVVIRQDERNIKRWQDFFDELRRKHLIPIVRIATKQTENGWGKFSHDDIENWVYFLNSLNWVTENRYVIVGNEPNHAVEWGGEVNPDEYADYLYQFSKNLKNSSDNFFIIPAGFDASAPQGKEFMSEAEYLKRMLQYNPNLFDYIDGWASHSYPNPGFSGSVDDTGRGTVRTYLWEKEYLISLGVNKELPVFITETGWAHNMDTSFGTLLHPNLVGESYRNAFENVWNGEVVAITPFILNYQEAPFDIFSWKKKNGEYYDFYNQVRGLRKVKGQPIQSVKGRIKSVYFPDNNSDNLSGYALIENIGESIWNENSIKLINNGDTEIHFQSSVNYSKIEPGQKILIFFSMKIPDQRTVEKSLILNIINNEYPISESYRISFPANVQSVQQNSNDELFSSLKTVLPFVTFSRNKGDILASI